MVESHAQSYAHGRFSHTGFGCGNSGYQYEVALFRFMVVDKFERYFDYIRTVVELVFDRNTRFAGYGIYFFQDCAVGYFSITFHKFR